MTSAMKRFTYAGIFLGFQIARAAVHFTSFKKT